MISVTLFGHFIILSDLLILLWYLNLLTRNFNHVICLHSVTRVHLLNSGGRMRLLHVRTSFKHIMSSVANNNSTWYPTVFLHNVAFNK